MRSQTFCMKFNFEQLLFEAFFDLYKIIFQPYQSFEPPSCTPSGVDRHMCSQTFLYEIQFKIAFFDLMHIFGSTEP